MACLFIIGYTSVFLLSTEMLSQRKAEDVILVSSRTEEKRERERERETTILQRLNPLFRYSPVE